MASPFARYMIPVSVAGALLAHAEFTAQTPSSTAARTDSVEELIAEKAASCPVVDNEDVGTEDGRKIAWRCRTGNKWTVYVNGTAQGTPFDEVRSLTFSPDSQHLAFAARRDKRWMVVEDGKEHPETYAEIGSLQYSHDSGRMVFDAKPDKKWVVVVDGQPRRAEFDRIVAWTFSPDSRRVAYVGRRGNKYVVVVDDKEGMPSDIIGGIRFSADNRRFAYAAANVNRGFGSQKAVGRVTIDGVTGPSFEGAQVGSLLKAMATQSTPEIITGYRAQFWSDTHGVTTPVFSPDASRVAYGARRDKDGAVVMLDGEVGPAFPSIVAGPVFSHDGTHIAFATADAGATTLVIDGAKVGRGPAAGTDFITELTFAPDNQRLAYIGVTGGNMYDQGFTVRARRRVYVDGVAGSEYNVPYLGRLRFSADGKHAMYVVGGLTDGSRNVAFVVMNGREGKRYDGILGSPRLEKEGRAFTYLAQLDRKFYSVRSSIEEPSAR